MEQQPGPVNWAAHNPAPLPGMVRLWTWEALAHGAEVRLLFPLAAGAFRAGADACRPQPPRQRARPRRRGGAPGGAGTDRIELGDVRPSPVALVVDYEAEWLFRIQPQVREFSYKMQALRWFSAVRAMGLDVDIVAPGSDLSAYRLVLVPSLAILRPATLSALRATEAVVLYGARTGCKTRAFRHSRHAAPGAAAGVRPVEGGAQSIACGLACPLRCTARWKARRCSGASLSRRTSRPPPRSRTAAARCSPRAGTTILPAMPTSSCSPPCWSGWRARRV